MVTDNSRNQYYTRSVGFVIWLYKNPQHISLLLPELLENVNVMMEAENKIVRSTIKVDIKGMNRHDSNSYPIKVKNPRFNIVT